MSLTLLITGGAGFIGSAYVRHALEAGNRVIVFDSLTYAGNIENLRQDDLPEGHKENFIFIEGDVTDAGLIKKILHEYKPDAVLHLAGESHVDRSIENSEIFVQTNIVGSYRMLNESYLYWRNLNPEQQEKFRYIHVSTDEVFGELSDEGEPFDEHYPYAPRSPYSASKAAGDHLVMAWYHTYKFPTIITHCGNNYGPRQHPEKLIPKIIASAISDMGLPIYGSGNNVRDWIHVEDHCNGITQALKFANPGQRYLFSGVQEYRNIDVVKMICKNLDEIQPRSDGKSYSEQITFVEDRLSNDWRYAINGQKSREELNFVRKYKSFEEEIPNTIKWYLNNWDWVKKSLA